MKWPTSETTCGVGSMLAHTEMVRAWLPGALSRLGVKRLLDAPCGDRNWIRHVDLPCAYVGIDHEPDHVDRAREDGASVALGDILDGDLPDCDAILSRDFMQHLSLHDEARALAAYRATGAKWLIATCHGKAGADCATGEFRFIDLRGRPEFGQPVDFCLDDTSGEDRRILGVWPLGRAA